MKNLLKQFAVEKAAWLKSQAAAIYHKDHEKTTAWAQLIISCVMMVTLFQNCRVINQTTNTLNSTMASLELQKVATSNAISQLEIEQETRLNPELECAYNWVGKVFVFRNVGSMAAENIFLQTRVFSVRSNAVLQLTPISSHTGTIFPPLEKPVLLPGEVANANQVYVPDTQRIAEFWKEYKGEILVRIYVEYERIKPAYHRYSGFYYFTMNSDSESLIQNLDIYRRFLTEQEKPLAQKILEEFNSMPRDQYKTIAYFGTTNMQEVRSGFGEDGVDSVIRGTTNSAVVIGSWSKHH